jgi:hypothetical protein
MVSKTSSRPILPLVYFFVLSCLFFQAARSWLAGWNMDYRVLLVGNAILFAAAAVSFILHIKALKDENVQVFLRLLYSSLLIKMVLCLGTTLLYVFLAGPAVSRSAILGCFALYILYTFMEVRILMRLSKKSPKNA